VADSRIRILFASANAAKASADFLKVEQSARSAKKAFDALSGTKVGQIGGLNNLRASLPELQKVTSAARDARGALRGLSTVNLSNLKSLKTIGEGASSAARGLNRLGAASPAIAEAAKSVAGMGKSASSAAPGIRDAGRAARTSAASFRTLASAAPQIATAAAALKGLSTELNNAGISNGAANLSGLGKSSRSAASALNALSKSAPGLHTVGAALKNLAGVLNNPVILSAFHSFAAGVPTIQALAVAFRALGRAGDSLRTLPANLTALAGALHNPFFQAAFSSFAGSVPAITAIATSISALSRSGTRLDRFALGLDKVRESLERMGPVASNTAIQDLLKNLAAIRAGGAGGGGGLGGGGGGGSLFPGLPSLKKLSGLTNLVTKPLELAYSGLRKGAGFVASGVGVVYSAVQKAGSALISFGRFGIGAVEGVANRVRGLARDFARLAVGTALGTGGLGLVLKKSFDSDNTLSGIENTLKIATGSAAAAQEKIATLSSTVDRLGLSFTALAPGLASFVIAAKGTALEGAEAERIYLSLVRASQALGLSSADQAGVARALNQILSKGTVQAEELRGQIGDRMPGAFNLAARAMGVTTAELGKLLKQGKVVSEDFLPKFADQLDKEFGNVSSSVIRPAAALERLKNQFFNTFVTIGRNGGTALVVDALTAVSKALKVLNEDGTIAGLARTVTGKLRTAGNAIIGFSRNVYEAIRQVRGGNNNILSAGLPFGDTTFVRLFGRNTKSVVRGYVDVINITKAFAGSVREQLAAAFNFRPSGGGSGAIDVYNRTLFFLANSVLPPAISGLKFLGRTFVATTKYVAKFVDAFRGINFGLGFQIDQLLGRIFGVQKGLQSAFGVSPQRLAYGVSYAVYLVNVAFQKLAVGYDRVSRFYRRLNENGTFAILKRDAKDFISYISGVGIGDKLNSTPESLADAFERAYVRIRNGIVTTYQEIARFVKGVSAGFSFERDQRKRTPKDQSTPDAISAYAQDQGAIDIGQGIGRFADQVSNTLPVMVELAGRFAAAMATAATNIISVLDAIKSVVGDESFGKLSGLLATLYVANKVTGGATNAIIGSAGTALAGLLFRPSAPPPAPPTPPTPPPGGPPPAPPAPGAATIATAVFRNAAFLAASFVGIKALGSGNDTVRRYDQLADAAYAEGRTRDFLSAKLQSFGASIYGAVEQIPRGIKSFIDNAPVKSALDDGGRIGFTKQEGQLADAAYQQYQAAKALQTEIEGFKDTRAQDAASQGYVSQFGKQADINLTIGSQTTSVTTKDPDGFVSWSGRVRQEQAGRNGDLSIAFGQ